MTTSAKETFLPEGDAPVELAENHTADPALPVDPTLPVVPPEQDEHEHVHTTDCTGSCPEKKP
ncbi:hypothetical protein [Kibdelosporangium phytohabitans]|uniref:Uncharacterized protein n=1 Tax=Kibdelosporangium phytohabitans TaxID=860235 RepID=A0A0N9HUY3_9PSEU|nr:hypothetical protein [Kibdelosporangium phytohabitans]ALG07309.1 hypothetical protein AOZ06_10590 [Kibdelosporangium phytohabitans]MBE1471824.1 hypothetical protein [Kibdelosporangium phytohabitans]